MTKDLSFLQVQPDDLPYIQGMKTGWQMVMSLPEPKRKVYFQAKRVRDAEEGLEYMIASNQQSDDWTAMCTDKARGCIDDFHTTQDERMLDLAEQWTSLAKQSKVNKYSIGDIRKQRERVQWEKTKLNQMKAQLTNEPNGSSSPSAT